MKAQGDAGQVAGMAKELKISEQIATLLVQRGITTKEEAKKFFRPQLSDLHDPFLMKGMDKAVERIAKAIGNKENILVYGDYDVDGTTAVALMYTFLHSFYENVSFYIPDRYKEGYGISTTGIDFAEDNDMSLIIALDCGIKAVDKVAYAKQKGIDFIICDHHLPGDMIPAAVAVLDPKQPGCNYPYKELSGCGLGFKLAQAWAMKNSMPFEELEQYLDLVVVSIASDIVPITNENRVLAFFGLRQINTSPRQGIKTLLELNNVKKELSITDLVFIIGPRINAAGRIDSGRKSVELLIATNEEEAKESSIGINQHNLDRRDLDTTITAQALEMIAGDEAMLKRKSTVVFNKDWHKGVVGIVASRLTEKYYRPTIVLTQSNGVISGSARSVKDFDVYEAIHACADLLEQFGGHKYAAGLSLKPENLEAFTQKFEATVSSTIEEYMLTPEIEIDEKIELKDITPGLVNILKQFAPFGPGNMAPVFLSEEVYDRGFGRVVGAKHLKMDLVQTDSPTNFYPAIAFGQAENFELIKNKMPFNACFTIEENEFNGKVSLQLNVKDMKGIRD